MVKLHRKNARRLSVFVLLSAFALTTMPALASASQISAMSLMDSDAGDVLLIEADAPLEYQVFDLDGPPRMVISFPEASLIEGLAPITSKGSGVISVFPAKDAKGARLEISISEPLGYKIEESGNTLAVKFSGVESEKNVVNDAAVLKDIEVRDKGGMTELVLRGDNMDASHNAFLSNNNQTLILDFWGGSSALPKENYQYSTQRIRGVTIGNADGRVRLVIDLLASDKLKQQIDVSKGELVVRIGNITAPRHASSLVVEDVAFQPDDRIAHLMIRTDSVNPILNISEKGNSVVIDLKKSHLAQGQERSQDVSAFPGPVKQVDSYAIGENVRIVARLRDKVDVTSYQQGNVFTINFEPQDLRKSKAAADGDDKFIYSGKKVTFDFKDMDITNALKLISEMSNLNIIMSDDVEGRLTMRLVDVPWDQALDIILSSQALGKQLEGNVMRIAPLSVLRKENKEELEGIKDVEMLEPLITQPITLSFARADKIKKMLDESRKGTGSAKKSGGESGSSILSSRGSYLVDERTNTLIVTDTAQSINNVKRFISIIDTPVEQVLIEARIVEASDNFTDEFGIRWGGQFTNNKTALGGQPNLQVGATNPTAANRFLVDLPAAAAQQGGAVGISFGAISKLLNLDLELSAAEIDGKAKIVSSPRVLTANGGKALIAAGSDVPFVTPATGNNPPTVSFKKAELRLEVTPQVTANRTVIMEVKIAKDAPTGATVLGNPILDTKRIQTNLQVKDGETIVIGGIFSRSDSESESGVPGLKEIPLFGWLFKTKQNVDNKTELLIFLTPSIVHGDGDKAGAI